MKLKITLRSLDHGTPASYQVEFDGVTGYFWKSFEKAYSKYWEDLKNEEEWKRLKISIYKPIYAGSQ
jgi:hypothetical protein